MAGYVNSRCL